MHQTIIPSDTNVNVVVSLKERKAGKGKSFFRQGFKNFECHSENKDHQVFLNDLQILTEILIPLMLALDALKSTLQSKYQYFDTSVS